MTVAEPSVICGGTSSDPSAVIVSEKDSSLSTLRSAVVEILIVFDVSPAAKVTVLLTCA